MTSYVENSKVGGDHISLNGEVYIRYTVKDKVILSLTGSKVENGRLYDFYNHNMFLKSVKLNGVIIQPTRIESDPIKYYYEYPITKNSRIGIDIDFDR